MAGMVSIPSRSGFLRARDAGEKAISNSLLVQAVVTNRTDWRVGLTASKKIGNAVARNRARRRMRALARIILAKHACNGMDYVLIARRDTGDRPWALLETELTKSLGYLHRKLGVAPQASAPGDTPQHNRSNTVFPSRRGG